MHTYTYILSTLEFPTYNLNFHLLTTSVNAKYYNYTLILHRHYHLINIYILNSRTSCWQRLLLVTAQW